MVAGLLSQANDVSRMRTGVCRRWPSSSWNGRNDSEVVPTCRNIKTLFNFEPPATAEEIRAASLQFVRKLSGFNTPSKANKAAFDQAVDEVAAAATVLLGSLMTLADPRNREVEAERAKARSAARFGPR